MKKLNINQKCLIWTLLTTLIILSAVNIAWALPVNERTQQVQDAIVAAVDGVNAADDVTDAHLAAITTLNLQAKEISTLKSGDFSGLSSLTTLYLDNNRLTSLPDDVFSGLSSLRYLYLNNNQLNNLPATLFSSLSSIKEINLHSNRLTRLPDNLFTGLTSLRQLVLHKNLLKSLDADTFSGLSSLEYLYLHNNQLTSLPANLFSKLTLLKHLLLYNNQLTHLSPGMFRGLSTPKFLWLQGNVVNPLSLNISVVKVGENQFKVIVPAGAPFDMNIPLTVTNGSITSGASGVTIATGAVESIPFTVAHTPDTTNAVSVDIGTLPSPPAFHFGYVLVNYTNTAPVFTEGTSATRSVAENTETGTNIGAAVVATDADDDPLTYTLSGTDAASFAIDNTTGQLKTEAALDFETENAYTVTVTVSDGYGGSDSITITINVTDIDETSPNRAPIFVEGTSTTRAIAENTAADTNIGIAITATDADNDTLTYTLSGNPDAASFAIDSTTGQLKTSASLDYETKNTYKVAVTVSDGALTDIINVTINIRDANDAPVFTAGSTATRTIAENTTSDVNIGAAMTATDADGDRLTYTLGGTDAASFVIDNTNGQLKTSASLNFETENAYTVIVTASDGSLTDTITVTINVTDVDENRADPAPPNRAPIFVEGDSTTRAVAQDTEQGINIGTPVLATDADDDTLIYTLGGTDAAIFDIDSTTGQLKTKVRLDVETKPFYTVTVTASDGSLTDIIAVTINLSSIDENNPPVFTEGESTTRAIAENTAAGTNIGTAITATDADDDTLTYTLSGTDAASFAIDNTTGQLKTKDPLDYETESSYSVTMTVSDGDLTDVINVNINIRNVNDAPVFIEGESATRAIAENTAAGTNIGTAITATDADDDTLTYTLSGTDAASFAIDNTTGQLKTKDPLDYETESSYSVTMTVSDGDLTDVINVNINIRNVNDAPVFIEGESATRAIAENTAADTNIGAPITATDDDDDTLIYELLGTDVASFTINSTNGQLKTKKNLDYETKDTYSVTILVTDRKLTDTIRVTINVTDVDENRAPEFTEGDSATRAIAENTAAGTNIGTAVVATDADDDTLAYTLGGTDATAFTIDSETGQLKTSAALDFETKKSYTVTVTVSDSSLTDIITVTINVRDVDENRAPEFTEGDSTTRSVAENTAADTNIGAAITATDADDDTLTYTLSGTDAASFTIVGTSGQLKTSAALDFETKKSYTVTVTVSDSSLTDIITVTITVTDVDENRAPVFTEGDSATRAIAENTAAGTNIGTAITATDADNDTLTYTLGGTNAAAFAIDIETGQLKTKASLDYETKKTYTVTVTVSDSSLTDIITVTITVTDVDENRAPVFTDGDRTTRSVAENTAADTNIGTAITATDADDDTLTYTLSGTEAASFAIDSETGQLKTSAALDFETKKTYAITVTVSDGSLTDIITVTINVLDVDENRAPVFTDGDRTTRSVAENTAADENIGTAITATDADNDTLTYTLSGTDAASFTIVGTSGQLKTSAALDFETDSSYSVTVFVSDSNGGSDSITVSITVTDVDESTPVTTFTSVCDRTPQVRDAIVAAAGVEDCSEVTEAHLARIPSLYLNSKGITSLKSGDFDGLTALTRLYLRWNDLSSLPSDIFDGLTALTDLWLRDNDLSSLPSGIFDELTALTHLWLNANDLSSLPSGIFDKLTALTILSLYGDELSSLPSDIFDELTALKELYLYHNDLSSLPSGIFDELTALKELWLSDNDLSSLPSDIFDELTALKELWLSDNDLSSLPSDIFDELTALERLGLGANDLSSLPSGIFDKLTALKGLSVDANDLSSLPSGIFDKLTALEKLWLGHNDFSSLPSGIFDGLTALTHLYLGHNDFSSLPSGIFDELTALTHLWLDHNDLSSLPSDIFDELTALTHLYLYNNDLSSLPSGIFDKLTALETLLLDRSGLQVLPSGIFNKLTALKELRLDHNGLPSLPLGVFDGLTALTKLDIAYNSAPYTSRPIVSFKIPVSLEKVGENQFKAMMITGAPFTVVLPFNVSNGSTSGGVSTITILTGSVESEPLTVTRTSGTTGAVTVDIGTLPELPSGHRGYVLTKPTTGLPLEVIPAVNGAPQSTEDTTPIETALLVNYPNPSNPETWIPYQLAKPADVSLTIYNVRGVVVRKLALGHQQAGIYHSRKRAAHWDGKNEFGESVASGVYFYVFKAGEYTAMRKMLIRK